MIVLDTNVVSELFRPRPEPRVIAWLEALTDDVAITAITLAELLAGARRLPDGRRKAGLEAAIDGAIQPYRDTRSLLAFDEAAAMEYAEVFIARERAGMSISMADAQIAAICRVHRATCATRNTKDFVQSGVELVDPWSVP
ncbi:type II toxin-antitoxin system VapC family toxin [Rhodococcus artemisiae]|uniref:Ribonuclease VapC n=1 Tax=Rhodococcus artemisiae TaxID=714159 RepID=A0ABU7LDF1_9NOCA|nr:type II toxin-antitoxin system VapC family toxin [Rhodococcus artemisiae]MEE2059569.1 type II toxin-antitoxin system VapC family toxin [Rhodococcus artemisiae]